MRYESPAVLALLDKARKGRPRDAAWHPRDIVWSGEAPYDPPFGRASSTQAQRPFATDPVLATDMPAWFARLSIGRLPFPELSVLVGRNIGSLRYVEAARLAPSLLLQVRAFASNLLKEEGDLRMSAGWLPDRDRDPATPQVRPTAPRRQRPRPAVVVRARFEVDIPDRVSPAVLARVKGTAWTESQTHYLRKRWSDGLSCKAISLEMSTSKNAILSKLYRLGLLANGSPVPYVAPARTTFARTSSRSRMTRSLAVRHIPATASDESAEDALDAPRWSPEQVNALVEGRSKGWTYTRIARDLGFETRDAIAKACEIGLMTGKGRFHPTPMKEVEPSPAPAPSTPTVHLTPGHPLIVGEKGWTQLQELYLCARRKEGASAWTIGKEMGKTKNSVIGKLDRLGFLRKGVKGNSKGAAAQARG